MNTRRLGIVMFVALAGWCVARAPATAAGPLSVEWTLGKTGKPLEREAILTVTDGRGQPVSGASVEVNVDMPSMPMMHKVPKAIAKPTGDPGRYKTRFTLEMAGEWAAQIEVKGPGRTKVVKKFTVD
jgi:uncharacterized GH25 family protein